MKRVYKVRCNLNRLMAERRHKVSDVVRETGLSRLTVTQLYNDESTAIRFDTIEKLCYLYECNIGDLLELVPVTRTGDGK